MDSLKLILRIDIKCVLVYSVSLQKTGSFIVDFLQSIVYCFTETKNSESTPSQSHHIYCRQGAKPSVVDLP